MKRKTPYNLTQARLFELVHYSPDTGIMVKLNPRPGVRIKTPEERTSRYIQMRIDGRAEHVHRLAFLFMTGEIPHEIDHRDGDGHNNRWLNLRACCRSQNRANGCRHANNTSGYKGVAWSKRDNRWRARIMKNGRDHYLGMFDTIEEAAKAYRRAAKRLFKEFARV